MIARAQPTAALRIDGFGAMTAAFSVLAAVIVALATQKYGPGLTPDSTTYLSTAANLRSGAGFIYHQGPYVEFPPLYPMALAAAEWLGFNIVTTIRVLDAASFAAAALVTAALIRRCTRSAAVLLIGLTLFVTATPLILDATYALTEMPFILFFTLFLLYACRVIERGHTRDLLLAATFAALASLTRYVGVALVPMGLVAIALAPGRVAEKLRLAVAFVAISVAPLVLWLARNAYAHGTLTGDRPPTRSSLADVLRQTFDTLTGWALPATLPLSLRLGAVAVAALALAVVVLRQWRMREVQAAPNATRFVGFLAVCAALYVGWVGFTASRTALQEIGPRYLSPAYVPLLVVALYGLDQLRTAVQRARGGARRFALAGIASVIILSALAVGVGDGVRQLRAATRDGAGGYATVLWQESALSEIVRQQAPFPGVTYCNDPYACYALVGISARQSPRRSKYNSPQGAEEDRRRLDAVLDAGTPVRLVYYQAAARFFDFVYTVDDLTAWYDLRAEAEATDGAIYRVTRKTAAQAAP